MTYLAIIQAAIRSYIMNSLTSGVVTDIATNGLLPADEAVVDAFLLTVAP